MPPRRRSRSGTGLRVDPHPVPLPEGEGSTRVSPSPPSPLPEGEGEELLSWFREQGWEPFPFQLEVWEAYAHGRSGLIHVPTGTGKTYAAYIGPLAEVARHRQKGLQILYVTPLRAVSRDIELALNAPLSALDADITVESRTGDTSSSVRRRQRERLPEVLITTPESLSLLLCNERAHELFATLRCVIVDEWHELLGSKRGTQVELALARLRRFAPALRTWALSATLANLDEAARAAVGPHVTPTFIRAGLDRPVRVETLLPDSVDAFPWAGHLGFSMLRKVADWLDPKRSTLLFTNTRSQAERWYEGLRFLHPEWEDVLALHHGSIDREARERVEGGLKDGSVRLVVATSSLDLGVDFGPVERVVQVGSPKGIARTLQRAGRSAHRPGATAHLLFVPTHALELVEMSAAREALAHEEVEPRAPLRQPLDVLAQHLVTCALGGGFTRDALLAEVRDTLAYQQLSEEDFDRTLVLVTEGGPTLRAYPQFRRVQRLEDRFVGADARVARLHKLNVGTISANASVELRYLKGARLGTVEESFVSRLRPGDTFLFAGKRLEFRLMKDLTAYVKAAKERASATPRWSGGRLPLSGSLAAAVRRTFHAVRHGQLTTAELEAARPVLEAQARLSRLPSRDTCLAELCQTREGHHLFLYPFEGRLVHEGLAALLAWRISRLQPITFTLAVDDYGIELLSPDRAPLDEALAAGLLSAGNLAEDIPASLNAAEMARRQFRDIARVAGLLFQGFPGQRKPARHLQASSGLFYEVFTKYDPGNLLLHQAHREVLEQQLERSRLGRTLARLAESRVTILELERASPLAFPLLVAHMRDKLSSEKLADRVRRMQVRLEKAAG